MAADIAIVAAGMVAATQPGMEIAAIAPPQHSESPPRLEQSEARTVIPTSLSLEAPELETPLATAAPAPEFSPGPDIDHGFAHIATIDSLAQVEAIETQLINQQLGQQAPLELPIAAEVIQPTVKFDAPQPLQAGQQFSQTAAVTIQTPPVNEQLETLEAEITAKSVGIKLPTGTTQVSHKIATSPTLATAVSQSASLPHISSSLNRSSLNRPFSSQAQRSQPAQVQRLNRFEELIESRTQQTRKAIPLPVSQPTEATTDIAQRRISPERLILAEVMMDSAEAQFLKNSGLDNPFTTNPFTTEASPQLNAQGSGPVVVDAIGQVTSVSQLRDVQPTDWAYQATQSLVERYGCAAGYPDGGFRGNRALSRYEFAAGLNACLDRVTELLPIAGAQGGFAAQEDLAVAQQLAEQFQVELEEVRDRSNALEQRQASLEAQQFSTTTKLYGQTLFGLRGSNNNNVDLFPVDGNPERSGAGEVTLGGSTELTLATSFRGNDLLLTTLQASNIAASASTQFTNMGRLAYEGNTNNQFVLSDLSYRFAATPNLGVIVGTHGVSPSNTFRGISPLEGSGDGALSRLGQRNPILELGGGRGGAGFDWQAARNLSLQGIYSATSPNQTGNDSGFFNGGYVAGGQVSAGLGRSADLGIHYLHSYSPNGSLGTGIGDAQVLSPFAESSFRTHAVGATAAWRPTRHLTVGGWGGWTNSIPTDLSGRVQTTNWMGFAQVNDLFRQGNALGFLVGQPPKITSSNLPTGFNFPEFSDGGRPGGREDTAMHVEAFYRAQLNDHISVTPGIVVVKNPNHNAANDTLVVGAMRTTFRF